MVFLHLPGKFNNIKMLLLEVNFQNVSAGGLLYTLVPLPVPEPEILELKHQIMLKKGYFIYDNARPNNSFRILAGSFLPPYIQS